MAKRSLFFIGALFGVFFLITKTSFAAEDWDLSYLLDVDPNKVTMSDLRERAEFLEEKYQRLHQVDGIIWQGFRRDPKTVEPDMYGSGGDSAIFTGHYLAAATFRYLVTRESRDLDKVLATLRGLHILTHISGVPGVIARCAFPADQAYKWGYPETWASRIKAGFVYTSPENIPDALDPSKFYPKMIFYTRATRDQLSGVLFGIATVWGHLSALPFNSMPVDQQQKILLAKKVVRQITEGLWYQLRNNDFKIRDQRGANDTNADNVTGLMKLQLLAMYKEVLKESPDHKRYKRIREKYLDEFSSSFWLNGGGLKDAFNIFSNSFQYYAWNLRFARAYSVWLLEDNHKRKKTMHEFIKNKLWRYVRDHQNPHFTFLYNLTNPGGLEKIPGAIFSVKAWSVRPARAYSSPLYGKDLTPNIITILFGDVSKTIVPAHLRRPVLYFKWQDDPWRVDEFQDQAAQGENTGMDFLLPYWAGRYLGVITPQ